jgi:hypothetical protein
MDVKLLKSFLYFVAVWRVLHLLNFPENTHAATLFHQEKKKNGCYSSGTNIYVMNRKSDRTLSVARLVPYKRTNIFNMTSDLGKQSRDASRSFINNWRRGPFFV